MPFDIPAPPAPRPGETTDWNGWDLLLRHAALKQAFNIAEDRKASDAAIAAANQALADSNAVLARAMKDAAALQLQAVTAPQAPVADGTLLQQLVVALAGAGVDSACTMTRAQAILAAMAPREMPPQVLPKPAS